LYAITFSRFEAGKGELHGYNCVLLLFLGICVISYYEVAVVCAASEQCIGGYKSTGIVIEKQ
jgi:hypothetical protein